MNLFPCTTCTSFPIQTLLELQLQGPCRESRPLFSQPNLQGRFQIFPVNPRFCRKPDPAEEHKTSFIKSPTQHPACPAASGNLPSPTLGPGKFRLRSEGWDSGEQVISRRKRPPRVWAPGSPPELHHLPSHPHVSGKPWPRSSCPS